MDGGNNSTASGTQNASNGGGDTVSAADIATAGLGALGAISGGMSMIDATTALGAVAGATTMAGGAIAVGMGLSGISAQGIAMGLDTDPAVAAAQLGGMSTMTTADLGTVTSGVSLDTGSHGGSLEWWTPPPVSYAEGTG